MIRTSEAITEKPFVIDGVALTPVQLQRLGNLMAGTARPGPGRPVELAEAIDIWRRQNHITTSAMGRQRWQVHSNSPTYRESEESPPPDSAGPAEQQAEGQPVSGPLQFRARITEAADATGKLWDVVIIREGWSLNGRYYSRQVLESAVTRRLFEGGKVCDYGVGQGGDGAEQVSSWVVGLLLPTGAR